MPAWLELEGPEEVARGEAVRLRWVPAGGHELRLALVVHHKIKLSTMDLDVPGRFGSERQLWRIAERAPGAEGEARLRVPADAPYSYPGTVLAFFWGVALAAADDEDDAVLGWSALRVRP